MCPPDKKPPPFKKNGGGGILLCKMTEGADVSDSANLSVTIVGADPCEIPLSGEMSRSDKRVAVRLRTPAGQEHII